MVSSLCKAWDMVSVKANHSKELLNSSLGINHREISDGLDFLGVRNATVESYDVAKYFKVY